MADMKADLFRYHNHKECPWRFGAAFASQGASSRKTVSAHVTLQQTRALDRHVVLAKLPVVWSTGR